MTNTTTAFSWVDVLNPEGFDIPAEADFQQWVAATLQHHDGSAWETGGPEAPVSLKVVSRAESQALNKAYRGKDKPTNVLSFPAELPPELGCTLLGDLAICAEVVSAEAAQQGKPVRHHWAHMVVHGVLHLLGYDHIKTAEAEAMEAMEIAILSQLGVPNPYEDRDE